MIDIINQNEFDNDLIKIDIDIENFVTKWFGERCEDFDPTCHCCQRWRNYDELVSNPFDDGLRP